MYGMQQMSRRMDEKSLNNFYCAVKGVIELVFNGFDAFFYANINTAFMSKFVCFSFCVTLQQTLIGSIKSFR